MLKKTISSEVSADNLAWLEREFMPARGIRNSSDAFESLINAFRATLGTAEFGEPTGQRVIRQALATAAEPLTASQVVAAAGLSMPTVRTYLARLKALGHVEGTPTKTRTTFAEAFKLTSAGRRVWIGTIRDPEERTIAELAAEDLEARGG